MITWDCPTCRGRLSAPESAIGCVAECVHCQALAVVPVASLHSAPPPRPSWVRGQPGKPAVAKSNAAVPVESMPSNPAGRFRLNLLSAVSLIAVLLLGVGLGSRMLRSSPRRGPHPPGMPGAAFLPPVGHGSASETDRHIPQPPQALVANEPAAMPQNGETGSLRRDTSGRNVGPQQQVPEQHVNNPRQDNDPPPDNQSAVPLTAQQYSALAQMATQIYRQQGHPVRLDPEFDVLQVLRDSANPLVRDLFLRADAALRDYVRGLDQEAKAQEGEMKAMARMMQGGENLNSDNLAITESDIPGTYTVESLSSRYCKEALSEAVGSVSDRLDAEKLLVRSDEARRSLWTRLVLEAPRHANPKSARPPAITIEIRRAEQTEFSGPFAAFAQLMRGKRLSVYSLVARNDSGQDLSQVTMSLKLKAVASRIRSAASDASDSGLAQANHYFVPNWKAGETLQLMTGRLWGSDGLRRSHEGTLSIWAGQFRLENHAILFDDNLRLFLKEVLADLGKRLDAGSFAEVLTELETLEPTIPARLSDVLEEASALRAAARLSQARRERLLAASRAGDEFRGRWTFGKFSGPFAMRFVAVAQPGKNVQAEAELFEPQQPTLYRRTTGRVMPAADRTWSLAMESGESKVGLTDRDSLMPAARNLLRVQGRPIAWQIADDENQFTGTTEIGEEFVLYPSHGENAAARIADLLAAPLAPYVVRHPQSIAPLSANLLTVPDSIKPYSIRHQVGEIGRGIGAGFYSVKQVFLGRDEPIGLSVSGGGEAKIWSFGAEASPAKGKARAKGKGEPLPAPRPVSAGEMSPTGQFGVAGNGHVTATSNLTKIVSMWDYGSLLFWDLKTLRDPRKVDAEVSSMQIFDGGREILMTGSSANEVTVWSSKGEQMLRQQLASTVTSFGASRDGAFVAAASQADRLISIWNLKEKQLVGAYRHAQHAVQQIHFNADASRVLTLALTEPPQEFQPTPFVPQVHVEIFDARTLEKLYEATFGRNPLCVAVSSDWGRVLVGCADGRSDLWDMKKGQVIAQLVGHQASVKSVALSADGRFAMTGGGDTWMIFWGLPEIDSEAQTARRQQRLTVAKR